MKNRRYEFWVGTKDKDTKEEIVSVDSITHDISQYFKAYELGFSCARQKGGYLSHDGTYIVEDSIRVTIITERPLDDAINFCDALKKEYNQESILLMYKELESEYC